MMPREVIDDKTKASPKVMPSGMGLHHDMTQYELYFYHSDPSLSFVLCKEGRFDCVKDCLELHAGTEHITVCPISPEMLDIVKEYRQMISAMENIGRDFIANEAFYFTMRFVATVSSSPSRRFFTRKFVEFFTHRLHHCCRMSDLCRSEWSCDLSKEQPKLLLKALQTHVFRSMFRKTECDREGLIEVQNERDCHKKHQLKLKYYRLENLRLEEVIKQVHILTLRFLSGSVAKLKGEIKEIWTNYSVAPRPYVDNLLNFLAQLPEAERESVVLFCGLQCCSGIADYMSSKAAPERDK